MKSPFKFLDPYEFEDRDAFFGRDAETKELYNLVTKNRLTFVYGPSGTGKTSLVQCGLANRFGGVDWLPIFVRRGENINEVLRREIAKALGEGAAFDGDFPAAVGALFNRYLRPVYLIFDQFEELFILGNTAEQQAFYDTIAELLEAELPCRILFILREDYFGHLNQFEKTVPELYHRKLRVEPMSRDNLRAVVAGSCKVFNIGFDDARRAPERIMDNILADKSGIHMPYVQVYLHMLYQEAAKEGLSPLRFTDAVIGKVGPITDVLGRFLQEQKTEIFKNLQQNPAFAAPPEDVVSQVLDVFVSKEGTKAPVGYALAPDGRLTLNGEAARVLAVLPPVLVSATIRELEKSRILRRSDDALELAHDTLAALIDQQRSAELRQLRDIRQRIETGYGEHTDSKGAYFFNKGQLARIEPFLTKLALASAQAEFLENSRAEAERLENAEKERVARELRLAEDKLAAEERARKRQRFFTWVIGAVALLALGASVFAYFQKLEADSQTLEARAQRKEAVFQKTQTDSLLGVSEKNEERADKKTEEVEVEKAKAEEQTVAALIANQNTDKALRELKITSDQAVTILLAEIDRNILHLEYDATFRKCQTAVNLKAQRGAVEKRVWEIAYFYTEADTAAAAVTFLNLLQPTDLAANSPGLQAKLRTILKESIPPAYLTFLKERYFPKTIHVEGGSFLEEEDSVRFSVSTFKMAKTETTFWQYYVFAKAKRHDIERPSWQFAGDNPAVNVNWFDAAFYLNWLNEREGLKPVYKLTANGEKDDSGNDLFDVEIDNSAKGYRLPTAAEWAFAARGGNDSKGFEYSGDSLLINVGWYRENSNSRTQPVGQKKPNELGLYDMSGNVWEWCRDWSDNFPENPEKNYSGPDSGSNRVIRGGSWSDGAEFCRSAFRYNFSPGLRFRSLGFRLVFVP